MNIIEQPTTWIGAYRANRYRFELLLNLGSGWTGGAFPSGLITLSNPITTLPVFIKVGDIVTFVFSAVTYRAVITSIANNRLSFNSQSVNAIPSTVSITATTLTVIQNTPVQVNLLAGNLAIGQPLTQRASFKAIPRNGVFDVDVRGYVQDLYSNIARPPVTGVDPSLFLNYKLEVEYNGTKYDLGTVKNSVYSTTQSTGTSYQLLRNGALELFNAQRSIYSYTLGNRLINVLQP
jgi:hypothetical protein